MPKAFCGILMGQKARFFFTFSHHLTPFFTVVFQPILRHFGEFCLNFSWNKVFDLGLQPYKITGVFSLIIRNSLDRFIERKGLVLPLEVRPVVQFSTGVFSLIIRGKNIPFYREKRAGSPLIGPVGPAGSVVFYRFCLLDWMLNACFNDAGSPKK